MKRSLALAGICWLLLGASRLPASTVEWVNDTDVVAELQYVVLQAPLSIELAAPGQTETIYGRVYHAGLTEAAGGAAQVVAELGYGPEGTDPRVAAGWVWVEAVFNEQYGNNDEYQASLTINTPGTYSYTFRFSFDGTAFTAADSDGAGSNPPPELTFDPAKLGTLTILPVLFTMLDVDGNGVTDPLTDGVMVMRYLFGFRGEDLVAGGVIDTENCERCDAAEIQLYFISPLD